MNNSSNLFLISGPCAIESRALAFEVATTVKKICEDLNINYIFKGSYRKANRTSLDSFQGIGDVEALEILRDIGKELNLDTITDVHETQEVDLVAPYVTHLQIPAFLCRQTNLLLAAGKSGKTINIKKGQFLSPEAARFAIEKVKSTGNENVYICERGVSFGYQDLIVDATAVRRLKNLGATVVMDCTHSLQRPNQADGVTGGNPEMIETIALSAVATGADGLFIETHPNPAKALSDPHTMLQLDRLEPLLKKVLKVKAAVCSP